MPFGHRLVQDQKVDAVSDLDLLLDGQRWALEPNFYNSGVVH